MSENVTGSTSTGAKRSLAKEWFDRAPLATVIALVGATLAVFAWVGLRSVERTAAESDYSLSVLSHTTALQTELQNHVDEMDGLSAVLSSGSTDPTPSFQRYVDANLLRSGAAFDALAYIELVTGSDGLERLLTYEIEVNNAEFQFHDLPDSALRPPADAGPARSYYVVTRAFGPNLDGTEVGRVITEDSAPTLSGFLERSEGTEATFGPADRIAGLLQQIDVAEGESPAAGLSLATPVYSRINLQRGTIVSRILLSDLLSSISDPEQSVALTISVGEEALATTVPQSKIGKVIGEPVTLFDTIQVQGHLTDLTVNHNQSWALLIGGLALSLVGARVTQSTRRHAITLGRLERSEHDARHDELTGLLNRSGLTLGLTRAVEERRGQELVGVLFLDLDRLKVVNDSIGHTAGDEVLMAVARRLETVVRPEHVVGRFGGDEFIIVTRDLPTVRDLTQLADDILDSLKEPAVLRDGSLQIISASIGISYFTDGESSAESLLRDADVAMYRAKDAGGGQAVVFDADLRAQAVARLEVERELRRAIRTGQLVVHYQPIVSASSGEVDRLEALVRWQHPVRGMVPPGAFLSVAAESGLIVDVGEHVLRESCRQAQKWTEAVGRPICISVNVAERQLLDNELLNTVRRVLAETGLPAGQLELELTEELIVERLGHRLGILRQLDRMGIKLAIDDFGTSRASLSQLKQLDMVSTLKIDRAFVIDIATATVDRKIVTAIIALAKSVGMETVAEGVEDADQATVLKELGVDMIQGFYFHRPAPSDQVLNMVRKPFELPWRPVPASSASKY